MKIFYKKDYLKALDLYGASLDDNKKLFKKYENEYNTRVLLERQIQDLNIIIDNLRNDNTKLVEELDQIKTSLKKAENDLKESMTDKFIVKKIKPGRTPNTNKTKISKPMSSNVRNFMRKEFE